MTMNHFEMMAAVSTPDKVRRTSTSSPQQMSVRDAILTAALERDVHSMFSHYQQQQANPPRGFSLPSSLLEANAHASRMDIIRDILSNTGPGRYPMASPSLLGGNTGLLLATRRSPNMLDAAYDQRRREYERIQSIRQQAIALTEESPFQKAGEGLVHHGELSQMLQQQRGERPVQQQPSLVQLNPEGALTALGSAMRKKNSSYIDVSTVADPDPSDLARSRRTRGGVTEPFPEKLHRMLQEVSDAGDSDIIGFYSHGRAFGVHDPDRFIKEVMPKYFKQSRLSSFQRQLNLYGFTRIGSGPDTGGYYHELFLQARPTLCVHMRRVGVPQGSEDRRKLKSGAKKNEPDFYTMKSVASS